MAKEKSRSQGIGGDKAFIPLPDQYRRESAKKGVIESIYYELASLVNGTSKHANVYLPYGYNQADKEKSYKVFYLLHGGGEDENLLFGSPGENRELKNILDNMIANGDIEPLIVVTPTFYGDKKKRENDPVLSHVQGLDHPLPIVETDFFYEELVEDLIPYVETRYNSYLLSKDEKGIKASRAYRAIGGFSMGSVATWSTFLKALDYIKYFVPLCGDCWALAQRGGGEKAVETAELLAKASKDAGFSSKDFYLLCACGKEDIAYPNMKPQIEAMKEIGDPFVYGSDLNEANLYFIEADGGVHNWHWVNQFIYNVLPDLFRA